ncbi:MAG: ubiquinone biosynthesis regulatory protein kinase UbiB [Legionellales bacterium]|nr:ubiquinone biosynthesis regulatory protein kinase UbiB [Legionellales bacterium]
MKSVKQFSRLLHMNFILARNGLDQVVVSLRLFAPFRFVVYFNPWNWFRKVKLTRGEALRKTLEELGPIFIKFGQALSTRPDILPPDIAAALCQLQDNVPPFSSDIALAIVEAAYGRPVSEVFEHFDAEPLASASVAQVHAAILKTGEDVVVKILRPNMRKIIEKDLSLLKTIAGFADKYWAESKRFKPKEIVKEFEHHLLDELNLKREAANGGQLRRNFMSSPLLYIPEIHWDYIRDNVLVMERIYGIPVSDLATLKKQGVNIKKLAERGLEIFFTQVFRDCFFHADMHPGNIFVSPLHPENPQYICVDFGIIGTLNDRDKRYLAENLLAFFNQDYRRVAELHVESGWVARTTRVDDFESAVRTLCEPIFQRSLKDISFAMLVMQLFQVARRFKMEIQPQLILLQKTLFAVEGLGRQLYPELDLWATAKPFLEKWLRDQMGPKALFHHLRENIPFFVEQLPYMPRLMYDLMMITKNREISDVAPKSTVENRVISKHFWYNGLGVGIFLVMALWGGVSYFNWVDQGNLLMFAMGAALFGGVTALTHRTKRS